MKAVNHYVIIDKVKETEKKVGGLIITEDTNTDVRYCKAKIISVGDLVQNVNDGDTIWYDKHAGYGIEYDNNYYFVIKASDIVLVD